MFTTGLLGEDAKAVRGDRERAKEERMGDFRQAMHWLIAEGERATSRQRYKGLGRDEPAAAVGDDGAPRVQIEDAIEADRVFTPMLMCGEVEPRGALLRAMR